MNHDNENEIPKSVIAEYFVKSIDLSTIMHEDKSIADVRLDLESDDDNPPFPSRLNFTCRTPVNAFSVGRTVRVAFLKTRLTVAFDDPLLLEQLKVVRVYFTSHVQNPDDVDAESEPAKTDYVTDAIASLQEKQPAIKKANQDGMIGYHPPSDHPLHFRPPDVGKKTRDEKTKS